MDMLIANAPKVVALVGGLAFIVSVIIEVIKNTEPLKKVPTQLVVIIVSIIVCTIGYVAYTAYSQITTTWYGIFAAFIASFIVAYVSMYGFDTLKELYNRFQK